MPRIAVLPPAERRLALLKAAFREVAEKGFSEVTLDDIARRAGVSKGVTLYHFESKEDGSSTRSTDACAKPSPRRPTRSRRSGR